MCRFLSGIVLPTGEVITNENTDSHEDLVESLGLRDDNRLPGHQAFAPVEFTSDTPLDADSYVLRMDDNCDRPEWFADEIWARVETEMRERVRKMILAPGNYKILLGGCYMIGEGVNIGKAVNVRFTTMGGGTITTMGGGTITTMSGGTITTMRNGTITYMWGGTITTMSGGTITTMGGGTITYMWSVARIFLDLRWPEEK